MEAECCALAGTDCRPTPLRRRAGRPQLKRDPLGGYEHSSVIRLLGYLFLAATCASAVGLWYADRRAQDYRQVSPSVRSFMVVPLRMRNELYTEQGRVWVGRFWQLFRLMIGCFIVAVVLMMLSGSKPTHCEHRANKDVKLAGGSPAA